MAVSKEENIMSYLFTPRFLKVPLNPAQDSNDIANGYRMAKELAQKLVLGAIFGVIRSVVDPRGENPIFNILGWVVATGMILTAADLWVINRRINKARENYNADWLRLHPNSN